MCGERDNCHVREESKRLLLQFQANEKFHAFIFNPLHPNVWKSIHHEARDGYHANVAGRKPRRYHRVQYRLLH